MDPPPTAHKTSIVRRNSEGFSPMPAVSTEKLAPIAQIQGGLPAFAAHFSRNHKNRLNPDEPICMPVCTDLSVIMHDVTEPCRQNCFFNNVSD
jgi:hypothetical protein